MGIALSLAESRGTDTLAVELIMRRDHRCRNDAKGFASIVEFTVARQGDAWIVVRRRVLFGT
jgi:hypothetical protein